MKHISLDPFRKWFGFTRRERRSSFFLLILIVFVAGIRFIVPATDMTVELIPANEFVTRPDTIKKRIEAIKSNAHPEAKVYERQIVSLEINTCDSAMLEALPGLGPVLSARIIKYRNLLGGYATVDQLKEVYGLSGETFDLVSGRIKADPSLIRKISINTADFKQMIRLPYFERFEVTAILKYRELKGRINGIDDLIVNKLITQEKADKVKWYLEF